MAQIKDAALAHELKRWMRPNAHRFVRPAGGASCARASRRITPSRCMSGSTGRTSCGMTSEGGRMRVVADERQAGKKARMIKSPPAQSLHSIILARQKLGILPQSLRQALTLMLRRLNSARLAGKAMDTTTFQEQWHEIERYRMRLGRCLKKQKPVRYSILAVINGMRSTEFTAKLLMTCSRNT